MNEYPISLRCFCFNEIILEKEKKKIFIENLTVAIGSIDDADDDDEDNSDGISNGRSYLPAKQRIGQIANTIEYGIF